MYQNKNDFFSFRINGNPAIKDNRILIFVIWSVLLLQELTIPVVSD